MSAILPPRLQAVGRTEVLDVDGRTFVYFGGCDYYRLTSDSRILRAMQRTLATNGASVSASRMTTGNHALYEKLEQELASFFDAESAVLMPNGYSANLALGQALSTRFSAALIDQQAHGSLWDAMRFFECEVASFPHRDVAALGKAFKGVRDPSRVVVVTDGLFPRNGAIAPLAHYLRMLPRTAMLWVDDAHAAAVLGTKGQGTVEAEEISRARVIQTITLSKGFGAYGGAILGARSVVNRVVRQSRFFAGSTPVPLPCAAAAREALRIHIRDATLRQRLFRNVGLLWGQLSAAGFAQPPEMTPILAFEAVRATDATVVQRQLKAAGIYPSFIRYGAERARGFFRFVICSEHTGAQLRTLGEVIVACRARLKGLRSS